MHILVTQRDKLGLKPDGGNNDGNDGHINDNNNGYIATLAVKMTLLILLLMMIVRLAIGPTTPSLLSTGAA